MSDEINRNRRSLFGTAAMTLAAAQFGFSALARAEPGHGKEALPDIKPGTNTSFRARSSRSTPAS